MAGPWRKAINPQRICSSSVTIISRRLAFQFSRAEISASVIPRRRRESSVVNQAFAQKYFPGEDPVGKRIKPGISTTEADPDWREIVGVVSDVKNRNLQQELRPGYFVPQAQVPFNQMTMVVRTRAIRIV